MKAVAVQRVSGLQRPKTTRVTQRRQNLVVKGVAEADRETVSQRPTVSYCMCLEIVGK